jgi:hypothetical protein
VGVIRFREYRTGILAEGGVAFWKWAEVRLNVTKKENQRQVPLAFDVRSQSVSGGFDQ